MVLLHSTSSTWGFVHSLHLGTIEITQWNYSEVAYKSPIDMVVSLISVPNQSISGWPDEFHYFSTTEIWLNIESITLQIVPLQFLLLLHLQCISKLSNRINDLSRWYFVHLRCTLYAINDRAKETSKAHFYLNVCCTGEQLCLNQGCSTVLALEGLMRYICLVTSYWP